MSDTKIQWTDKVWNPVTGCTKVSQGCENCYAEHMAKRLAGRVGYPPIPDQFKVVEHPERLALPARWKKPSKVFVDSMGDLFHEDVDDKFIGKVFWTMGKHPRHTFQILTKRPQRMCEILKEWLKIYRRGIREWVYPLPNVWMGVSVENQKAANARIPWLLKTPAAVRFVSCEPLLEPVNIVNAIRVASQDDVWDEINAQEDVDGESEPDEMVEECEAECDWINYGNRLVTNPEYVSWHTDRHNQAQWQVFKRDIHWIICGGESGPGARWMDPDWARSLRDQCQAVGIPFFFKHWGDHKVYNLSMSGPLDRRGRKLAGRLLDGREWNEYPNPR